MWDILTLTSHLQGSKGSARNEFSLTNQTRSRGFEWGEERTESDYCFSCIWDTAVLAFIRCDVTFRLPVFGMLRLDRSISKNH
jgi:hypothetical protein